MPPIRLDTFLPYRVAVLSDRLSQRLARVYEGCGLSSPQWRVLAAVAEKPGRSAQDVVRMTPMEKATVSRAVSALIARGLMRREADDRDGRTSRLTLTAEGERLYGEIAPGVLAIEADIAARCDKAGLLGRVGRIERHVRGAGTEHSERRDRERQGALDRDPHPRLHTYPQMAQPSRKPVRASHQLGIGERLGARHHGDRRRRAFGLGGDRLVNQERRDP